MGTERLRHSKQNTTERGRPPYGPRMQKAGVSGIGPRLSRFEGKRRSRKQAARKRTKGRHESRRAAPLKSRNTSTTFKKKGDRQKSSAQIPKGKRILPARGWDKKGPEDMGTHYKRIKAKSKEWGGWRQDRLAGSYKPDCDGKGKV